MQITARDPWSQLVPCSLSSQHGLLWALSECLRNWGESSQSQFGNFLCQTLVWCEGACKGKSLSAQLAGIVQGQPLLRLPFSAGRSSYGGGKTLAEVQPIGKGKEGTQPAKRPFQSKLFGLQRYNWLPPLHPADCKRQAGEGHIVYIVFSSARNRQ